MKSIGISRMEEAKQKRIFFKKKSIGISRIGKQEGGGEKRNSQADQPNCGIRDLGISGAPSIFGSGDFWKFGFWDLWRRPNFGIWDLRIWGTLDFCIFGI